MPVGAVIGKGQVDNIMSSLAVGLRDVAREIYNLDLTVNGQGGGLAYLESIGYSADPNPANPGGVSDAELALSMISYLNTVSKVYFGTGEQTPPFSFDQELSQLWGGQV